MPRETIEAVLFDLDGTLADTAPDLGHALNALRASADLDPVPLEALRPLTSAGTRGMLWGGFQLRPSDAAYAEHAARFLDHYAQRLCVGSHVFPAMFSVLDALEEANIPWGVVTNKPHRFTVPLLEALSLADRAACIVSGDSTPHPKPAPDALLLACEVISTRPQRTLYVGDDLRDIDAGRAAGMPTVAAAWGYLGLDTPINEWGADWIAETPDDVLRFCNL